MNRTNCRLSTLVTPQILPEDFESASVTCR
jgi:hypothetical protein